MNLLDSNIKQLKLKAIWVVENMSVASSYITDFVNK